MERFHIMNYIRPVCYAAIALGAAAIIYKRCQKRELTYREIEDWARSVCSDGDNCNISRLSKMPSEVRESVRKQNGLSQILNGYKEDTSVFVIVTDATGNVKDTSFFMGKSLDRELQIALSSATVHRIKF